jgi:hypothetical protein
MKTNQIKTFVQAHAQTEVTFNKQDGTLRVLLATNHSEMIPAEHTPKGTAPQNPEIVRTFDIENQGWRSFRIDSVTKLVGMNNLGEVVDVITEFAA